MFKFQTLRSITACVLLGMLSGVVPATAAQQPGTLAAATLPSDLTRMAELPRVAQQPDSQTASGAAPAPATHHLSRKVWVIIVAGIAAGVATGVIVGNRQSGKTAATATSVTIGAGSGGSAGAP